MSVAEVEQDVAVVESPVEVLKIEEKAPGALISFSIDSDFLRISVRREQIVKVLEVLRDDPDLDFNFFA